MSSKDSLLKSSASSHHSEIHTTSSGEEILVNQASDGLEENLAQTEEVTSSSAQSPGDLGKEADSSSQGPTAQSSAIDLDSYTRGAWMGSNVTQAEIDWLYQSRRILKRFGATSLARSVSPSLSRNLSRIRREEPASYTPNRRFQDDCDADPYVKGKHKMGLTHIKHPDLRSAGANPQVVERTIPLAAEVGQEFLDNLVSRGRKNKAPAPEAGPSEAPLPSTSRRRAAIGPMAGSAGTRFRSLLDNFRPPLSLTRSAPGMRPEAAEDAARTSPPPPPHASLVPSGAGKSPASPPGGNTSLGRAAPEPSDPRAEEDFTSPPEVEDTGANNIGAGTKEAERAEPPVPPTPKKKKKKATASPSKTVPEPSAPATVTSSGTSNRRCYCRPRATSPGRRCLYRSATCCSGHRGGLATFRLADAGAACRSRCRCSQREGLSSAGPDH
nr:formin-like protein 6 [Lolium perenne]